MAVKRIDSKRLFEDKITAGIIKDMDALVKKSDETTKAILKTVDALKQIKDVKSAKDLRNFTEQTKKLTDAQKQRQKNQQTGIVIAKKIEDQGKRLKIANSDRIQQVVQLTRLTKDQNAINKDTEILNSKQTGTLEKLAASSRKLRREREGLNLDTEKGRKRLKAINLELDKNNKIILKNSDSLKKQKMNVGNYSESIKEAAGASGLFGKVLGPLAAIQGTLNALMKKNVVANEASAASTKANAAATTKLSIAQKASAVATGIGTKALRIFKFALASTGIGLLVVALGAMVAFFSRSQKGIDFLAVKMGMLGAAVDVIIDAFAAFGEAVFDAFSEPKKLMESLITFIKKIPGLVLDNIINRFKAFGVIIQALIKGDLKGLANGFIQLSIGVTDFSDKASAAIILVGEAAKAAAAAAKKLADEIAEKARIAGILIELTIKLTREEALFSAQQAVTLTQIKELTLISKDKLKTDEERIAALKKAGILEEALGERQLELAEQRLAASLDGLSADEKSLKNDEARLKFIEGIKNGTISIKEAVEQAAAFTLSSAKGEEALFDIIQKIKDIEQERQNIAALKIKTTRQESALEVQVGTKQAQAQVREAAAFRELAKDKKKSIKDRVKLFQDAAALEILSFETQVKFNIKNEKELAAAKLQITAKLQADIKKLTDGIEGDPIEAAKKKAEILNQIEQESFQQNIDRLKRRLETEELTKEERIKIINELFAIEITKATKLAAFIVSLEGKTAEEIELINLKKAKELEDIENARVDAVKEANKEIVKDDEKTNKERVDNAVKFGNQVFNSLKTQLSKQNGAFNEALNNEITALQESIDRQLESNREGGEQKLADDQALLAKRELERKRALEAQAKQERLIALSQQFVNSAAAHAKDDPEGAIVKALAEVFAAEGIAKLIAGFEKGGLVEGGEQIIKINEKGQEFVLDHSTTKSLGLDKPGSKMADFHKRFNHNINIPEHLFRNIDLGGMTPGFDSSSINKGQNEAAEKIANTIKSEAINYEMFLDGVATVVTKLSKGGKTEKIIYERDSDTF